jgi:hypothetical protein
MSGETWYTSLPLDGTISDMATPTPHTHARARHARTQKVGMFRIWWRKRQWQLRNVHFAHQFHMEPPSRVYVYAWCKIFERKWDVCKGKSVGLPCSAKLETYLTPTNTFFYTCSYNLLRSSYMFRRYIMPSSGSWYQSFYKTSSNKTGHNRRTYVINSAEYYSNILQYWHHNLRSLFWPFLLLQVL